MSEKNEFELKRLDHIHQERIKYIEFNNQYTLIQHETHCECFRDSIKYSVELSKTALNGALILMGRESSLSYIQKLNFYIQQQTILHGELYGQYVRHLLVIYISL